MSPRWGYDYVAPMGLLGYCTPSEAEGWGYCSPSEADACSPSGAEEKISSIFAFFAEIIPSINRRFCGEYDISLTWLSYSVSYSFIIMAKNKTTETAIDPIDFIHSYVENEQKKEDSLKLLERMKEWSGYEPKMWGPTMIGFGTYQYTTDSGHSGEFFIIGFSPRKAAFSLYVKAPGNDNPELLEKLGNYKMAKTCIYVKKLADIDVNVLKKLCKASLAHMKKNYVCS